MNVSLCRKLAICEMELHLGCLKRNQKSPSWKALVFLNLVECNTILFFTCWFALYISSLKRNTYSYHGQNQYILICRHLGLEHGWFRSLAREHSMAPFISGLLLAQIWPKLLWLKIIYNWKNYKINASWRDIFCCTFGRHKTELTSNGVNRHIKSPLHLPNLERSQASEVIYIAWRAWIMAAVWGSTVCQHSLKSPQGWLLRPCIPYTSPDSVYLHL